MKLKKKFQYKKKDLKQNQENKDKILYKKIKSNIQW